MSDLMSIGARLGAHRGTVSSRTGAGGSGIFRPVVVPRPRAALSTIARSLPQRSQKISAWHQRQVRGHDRSEIHLAQHVTLQVDARGDLDQGHIPVAQLEYGPLGDVEHALHAAHKHAAQLRDPAASASRRPLTPGSAPVSTVRAAAWFTRESVSRRRRCG